MRRRELLLLVGGATTWPFVAATQQTTVPTIGILMRGVPGSERFLRLFRQAMRELGYVEGQNIRYELRSDEGQIARLPELATEQVQLKPDVIVTWMTPAGLAAKHATSQIPIVMAVAANPVETGLVASLARPGGNVTGMSTVGAEVAGKCVELLREVLPSAQRIVALANAPDPFSQNFLAQVRASGVATGLAITEVAIQGADELDAAFRTMEQDRADGIIVQPSLPTNRVAELALSYRMPAVSFIRGFVDAGGLMSYAFAEAEAYRRAAVLVDKVLKGAKPADLPVEQPTKFELVINLKTAKALGVAVPQSLLDRADELIE